MYGKILERRRRLCRLLLLQWCLYPVHLAIYRLAFHRTAAHLVARHTVLRTVARRITLRTKVHRIEALHAVLPRRK